MLKTVAGGSLWAMEKDGAIWLKDEKGGMSMVTIANVLQSNGVIHVVDTVVMPASDRARLRDNSGATEVGHPWRLPGFRM